MELKEKLNVDYQTKLLKVKIKEHNSGNSDLNNSGSGSSNNNKPPQGNINKTIIILVATVFIIIILLYFLFFKKSETITNESKNDTGLSTTDQLKSKELDLKEKELELKEKELKQQKEISENLSNLKNKSDSYNDTKSSRSYDGIFPEASERYLNSSEIYKLSQWDLKIMRNEIFARHGYIFQTDEMRNYFLRKSWYSPRYNDVNGLLSKIEKENIALIKRFER